MSDNQSTTKPLCCEENFIHEDQVLITQKHMIDCLTTTHPAHTFQALSNPTRVCLITRVCECRVP